LTFDQARQVFEEVKSEFPDVPETMTFEQALAMNLLSERQKRSVSAEIVSDDEAYHAVLRAKGQDLDDWTRLEGLRTSMIEVVLDVPTEALKGSKGYRHLGVRLIRLQALVQLR